jgi:hypothetical protein
MFKMTDDASISISLTGEVTLLIESTWHDITKTNLGSFLLERYSATAYVAHHQFPETNGTVQ